MSRVPRTSSSGPGAAARGEGNGAGSGGGAGSGALRTIAAGAGVHLAFEASLEFFLSPLLPFLNDSEVNEIMVNGHDKIYIEKAGRLQLTAARFPTETDVQAAANNIAQFVGQPLSHERPLLDGRLPDGSRVCIVMGKIASHGTHINIRRFAKNTATPDFLLAKKAATPMALEFLLLAVKGHRNIVVSGGAGSGKTTCVNVLTTAFAEDERIVVIEDTRELQVQRPHVVQMEAADRRCVWPRAAHRARSICDGAADAAGPDCGGRGAARGGFGHDPGDDVGASRVAHDRTCFERGRYLLPPGDHGPHG